MSTKRPLEISGRVKQEHQYGSGTLLQPYLLLGSRVGREMSLSRVVFCPESTRERVKTEELCLQGYGHWNVTLDKEVNETMKRKIDSIKVNRWEVSMELKNH